MSNYDRQQKYWELSGFLDTMDYRRKENPDLCKDDLINKYLDDRDAEAKAWANIAAYEADIKRCNDRLFRAIKKVKGRTFYTHLCYMTEDISLSDKMQIIHAPQGTHRKENEFGRSITESWGYQRATNLEGDSFAGYFCIKLKPNKYLKISYSC